MVLHFHWRPALFIYKIVKLGRERVWSQKSSDKGIGQTLGWTTRLVHRWQSKINKQRHQRKLLIKCITMNCEWYQVFLNILLRCKTFLVVCLWYEKYADIPEHAISTISGATLYYCKKTNWIHLALFIMMMYIIRGKQENRIYR